MCCSASRSTKCLFFVTGGLTILYWLLLVPLLFKLFHGNPDAAKWSENWKIIYFAIVFLLWGLFMFVIVGLWYLCQNHFYQKLTNAPENTLVNTKEDMCKIKEVNEKVRQTLGLDDDFQEITKAVLFRKSSQFFRKGSSDNVRKRESSEVELESLSKTKRSVSDFELEAQITPLPEYSPEAKSTIFDFSETSIDGGDARSSSPFQEYLHLVQIESPGTPGKSFEQEIADTLNAKIRGKDNEVAKLNTTEKYPSPIKSEILLKQPPVKKKISIINEVDEEIQIQLNNEINNENKEEKNIDIQEGEIDDLPLNELPKKGEKRSPLEEVQKVEDNNYPLEQPPKEVENNLPLDELLKKDDNKSTLDELRKEEYPSEELYSVQNDNSPPNEISTKGENTSPLKEFPREDELRSPQEEEYLVEDNNSRIKESPLEDLNIVDAVKETETKYICPAENILKEEEMTTKKPKPKLTKKESCMFLGKIGRVGSDVSEMFLDITKGNAILDTIVVTGRSQIIKGPLT